MIEERYKHLPPVFDDMSNPLSVVECYQRSYRIVDATEASDVM